MQGTDDQADATQRIEAWANLQTIDDRRQATGAKILNLERKQSVLFEYVNGMYQTLKCTAKTPEEKVALRAKLTEENQPAMDRLVAEIEEAKAQKAEEDALSNECRAILRELGSSVYM